MPTEQDNDKGLLEGSKFLYRIKNIEYLTAAEVQRKIVQKEDFETEKVIFGGAPLPFKFKSPKGLDIKKQEIGDVLRRNDLNDVAGVERGGNYMPEPFI